MYIVYKIWNLVLENSYVNKKYLRELYYYIDS